MSFQEKDFQSLFTKYVKGGNSIFQNTTAFELKCAKGNSLPFGRLEQHQEVALKRVKHEKLYHKISDLGAMGGYLPFDCFQIVNGNAYVVILYYTPRMEKTVYVIDVDVFSQERTQSSRKSLTKQRASEIANYTITL